MKSLKEQYIDIFSPPSYLEDYLKLEELQLLKERTFFCGCDNTPLFNMKFEYTRFDHSIVTASITHKHDGRKEAVISSLLHDVGTPAFSHCIDFLLNDYQNQESSEKEIKEILGENRKLLALLKRDNLTLEDIINPKDYPIGENKNPKLCADRLDGILSTASIWLNKYSLEEIKKIYSSITVLNNENEQEIGFTNIEDAEKFYQLAHDYSLILQGNEDQFTLRFHADATQILLDKKIITFDELYTKSEKELISLFQLHVPKWEKFTKKDILIRSNSNENNEYYERLDVKKRYVNPLCLANNEVKRIDEVSPKVKKLVKEYCTFTDSKYYKI